MPVEKFYLQDYLSKYGALTFFVLLILINTFITPNFLQPGTLRNLLLQVFPIVVVSLGMTFVIASGGIDISVGSIMAIAGAVTARIFLADLGVVTSILIGLCAASLCGFFNGFMVAVFRIQPIIITLILMIGGRGLAQIILGELFVSLYATPFTTLGSLKVWQGIPIQVIIMLFLVATVIFVARKTIFAKNVEAIGDNRRAARLSGISIPFSLISVYMLCGLLCGIAGIMGAARVNAMNAGSLGLLIELDAIAAVAIGGTPFTGGKPNVLGTVIGALIVQLVTVSVNMNNISFHYSLAIKALIIIFALYLQREVQN
jgi:ribose/xylose/arabinose/galactoside ABC-type transport system permease subunit